MTHDEMIEKTRAGWRWVLADIEPGTRVHELTDEEVEDLARAAIRVIAPAVLEEAIDKLYIIESDVDRMDTRAAIRAMKTRYEQ